MKRAFTQYWSSAACRGAAGEAGAPLVSLAGDAFAGHDLRPGDCVYPIVVRDGRLALLGRVEVGIVADARRARTRVERVDERARLHVLARECTTLRFDRFVPKSVVSQMRFIVNHARCPVVWNAEGELDPTVVRGVRELDRVSAHQLDALLAREITFRPVFPEETLLPEPRSETHEMLAGLLAWFEAHHYRCEIDRDGDLTITLDIDDDVFFVLVLGNSPYVSFFVRLPVDVPPRRHTAVAEALLRASYRCAAVYFDFDYDEGSIHCRSRTLNPRGILDADDLGDLFEVTVELARRFAPAFRQVIADEATPERAVEAVLAQVTVDVARQLNDVEAGRDREAREDLGMRAIDLARLFRSLQTETRASETRDDDA